MSTYHRWMRHRGLTIDVEGAVASWLARSTPERVLRVRDPGRGHCVVFLGKTLYSHGASLHPGV